jgi:Zn-dependent protease with chaperone function
MPFLLLLFLTWVCFPDNWGKPAWAPFDSPGRSAAATWLLVALVIAGARAITVGVARHLTQYPGHRERVLRRYSRLRAYYFFILLGTYSLSVYVIGWGWAVQSFCSPRGVMLPGAELLLLAPFLAGLVLSWVVFYDAERVLHDGAEPEVSEADIQRAKGLAAVGLNDRPEPARVAVAEPFWSRREYVTFHIRQNLALVFAPLLLLLVLKGLGRLFPEAHQGPWESVISYAGGALSLAVILCLPWLLRLVLGLKPLPAGPLRSRLEAAARRVNFRCSNILVWHTRGGVDNAMVAGVVPWVRYVILTDRLLTDLTPDEVEAVFGHEMGHAKHHHMLYYLGFLLGSFAFVFLLWSWLALYLHLPDPVAKDTPWSGLPMVTMLGAYIFVVFGFLSRRCERQADVYGCRTVSCDRPDCAGHDDGTELASRGSGLCPTGIRTFIDALEKVARLNGIPREKPGLLSSWLHSTIARRVGFLQGVLADRGQERHFQRRVALVKWALFLGLIAAVGVLDYETTRMMARKAADTSPAASGDPE